MKISGTVGGGFTPPDLPDDLYEAEIIDVCEPYIEPDPYRPGQERTRLWVDWKIGNEQLRYWVGVPGGMFNQPPVLSEKANMYDLLDALGFIAEDGSFDFDTETWIGKTARVMVENKPSREGEQRPYITAIKAPRAVRAAPVEKKTPVGLRSRLAAE